MKALLLLFSLLLLASVTHAASPSTAKTAVRALSKAAGTAEAGRLVYVFGPHGQDQPKEWLLVTRDRLGVFKEHKISGKSYQGARSVPGFPVGAGVDGKRWKVDSTGAFSAADKTAKVAKRGFEYANLEMRCAVGGTQPEWLVTLVNAQEQRVAQLRISGQTGRVVSQNFFLPQDEPLPPPAPKTKRGGRAQAAEAAPTPPVGATQYLQSKTQPSLTPAPAQSRQPGIVDRTLNNLEDMGQRIGGWLGKLTTHNSRPAPVNDGVALP